MTWWTASLVVAGAQIRTTRNQRHGERYPALISLPLLSSPPVRRCTFRPPFATHAQAPGPRFGVLQTVPLPGQCLRISNEAITLGVAVPRTHLENQNADYS